MQSTTHHYGPDETKQTRSATIVPKFCKLGLVRHLTALTKSDIPKLVLASLKILRLTLHQGIDFVAAASSY